MVVVMPPPGLENQTRRLCSGFRVKNTFVELADDEASADDFTSIAAKSCPPSMFKTATGKSIDLDEMLASKIPVNPGSMLHSSGKCRPCAWYWRPGGCENGQECQHCHLCESGAVKQRKKEKAMMMRQRKVAAASAQYGHGYFPTTRTGWKAESVAMHLDLHLPDDHISSCSELYPAQGFDMKACSASHSQGVPHSASPMKVPLPASFELFDFKNTFLNDITDEESDTTQSTRNCAEKEGNMGQQSAGTLGSQTNFDSLPLSPAQFKCKNTFIDDIVSDEDLEASHISSQELCVKSCPISTLRATKAPVTDSEPEMETEPKAESEPEKETEPKSQAGNRNGADQCEFPSIGSVEWTVGLARGSRARRAVRAGRCQKQ
eukprot:gnl/TRDRNA2_/TRDRNA2_188398_c0_seq1.p1 gnl/TRDRNA2_/TRDRNA2_188398_c0~~gnl/TRDRNA2_/TRDRNA2_188398_c0_seq1.p1  ORF type:complete len:404 (+),score=70.74 gnl/TRDRNA2_/TRDRNA2_188398_c0_seq1:83-1213(+)